MRKQVFKFCLCFISLLFYLSLYEETTSYFFTIACDSSEFVSKKTQFINIHRLKRPCNQFLFYVTFHVFYFGECAPHQLSSLPYLLAALQCSVPSCMPNLTIQYRGEESTGTRLYRFTVMMQNLAHCTNRYTIVYSKQYI